MAYYSMHAYDADVWIPQFSGLRQSDDIASDLRFAIEAENVETARGVLQPMAAPEMETFDDNKKIETIARFHRRWFDGTGSKDWVVVAAGGSIYYRQEDADEWEAIDSQTTFTNNVWSFVTYEINPAGSLNPVDVLLMSNADDGMIMIVPPYTADVSNPDWRIDLIDTRGDPSTQTFEERPKFGVIERYAERIWGGSVAGEPDALYYSVPYEPDNWQQNNQIPEDGGGKIQQPSWDGDSFTALRAFGDQLIAFKKNHIWRVLGTDPGQYTFKEQYGGGGPHPNTIAVENERILMTERDGISTYDGLSVSAFNRPSIEDYWKRINRARMDQMCAALFKHRYYLAIPMDGSEINNALIVYNIEEGSFLLYTDIHIESLMATEEKLYATSSTIPGKIMTINYDSWETGASSGKRTMWKTAWIDFGRKSVAKGGYEIYFSPEVKGGPVTFRFSIETEKKTKSKMVTVQTTTFKAKQKRIRFGGTSRRFRLIIETVSVPQNTVWRLLGGIQMVVEIDPD